MDQLMIEQVTYAIQEKLYCYRGHRATGGPAWWRPIRIEGDGVILVWGDCGSENHQEDLTVWYKPQWREAVAENGNGLYRKVGFWSFEPAGNPAVDCIRFCHKNPSAAGQELYELRHLLKLVLEEKLKIAQSTSMGEFFSCNAGYPVL